MTRDMASVFAMGDEAVMLADLAQLTPEPAALPALLGQIGYHTEPLGTGLYAPALERDVGLPALLFPLYANATLSVRKRQLVGRNVSRSATISAGLAALRSMDRRPALVFLSVGHEPPAGMLAEHLVSLEGGVVPRIWRHCFGSFDALARMTSKRSHPGLPNTATNAIESAIPVLQALLRLKADVQLRSNQRGEVPDAPLQPRLTISAAHGGSLGSVLPSVFDVLLNRRYDPDENVEAALDEIKAAIVSAANRNLRLDVEMTAHNPPAPDPDAASRSREERAIAAGWRWPQVPFYSESKLIPGARILGGLERPEDAPQSDTASTTLDEMMALARTIRALMEEP